MTNHNGANIASNFHPARRCLRPEQWPLADREAWAAAFKPGNLLDPPGPGAHLSPARIRNLELGYGRWLTWCEDEGYLQPGSTPAERLTKDRLKAYVAHLEELNSSKTVMIRIQQLGAAIRLMAPGFDPPWLRNLEAYLERTAKPCRNKRLRVVPAKDLFDLGLSLMAQAQSEEPLESHTHEILYRDGLMIALLAARPLRLKNLTGIRIGMHLVRDDQVYWLVFQGAETKTGEPIEAHIPMALTLLLDHYLAEIRPRLFQNKSHPAEDHDHLWVGRGGTRLTDQSIRKRIEMRTEQAFGRPINPHLFRDCVATSIAIEDPAHVQIAAAILGHNTLATTEKYYNQATSLEASRALQKTVLELRGNHPDPTL